jgi:hypothetical protein
MKYLLLFLAINIPLFAEEEPRTLEAVAAEMANAANAVLTSLNPEQRNKTIFAFDSEERENWGFVPRERKGIPLEELTDEQLKLIQTLLKTALSEPGLNKVDAIMALEAFLAEIEKRPEFRNSKAYFTSIFGEPSAKGTWAWRFEGHHLSLNYTISDGKAISVTPSFFAANPAEVKIDHKMKGTRPLHAEEDLARALALTLKETGKEFIFSEKAPEDILTTEDRRIKQLEPVGISAADISPAQQQALVELISEYANRHRKELAGKEIAIIKKDLPNLRFGWAGSLERDQPFYYRIQGTTFLVEVANVQNHGNHIHAVWRDAAKDFGRDILGDHIHESHED